MPRSIVLALKVRRKLASLGEKPHPIQLKTSIKPSLWIVAAVVVNKHFQANGCQLAELFGCKHRNAYAAVAGGLDRHRWAAMNGNAAMNVIWVIKQTERAFTPTHDFVFNSESPQRRDCSTGDAPFGEVFAGTCGNRQDAQGDIAHLHKEKHLATKVNFDMWIA